MQKIAISGLTATLAAVVLFWLMGMNFCGWLGAWIAPGAAWIVGILLAAAAGFGFAALWTGTLAKQDAVKKVQPVFGAALYGLVVGLVFVFVFPPVLSAIAGNPSLAHSTAFDGLVGAVGGHVVPALPDWFDPPFASWVDNDWIHRDDYVARLLPFSLAFALYGLVLGLTSQVKK
jgi:tetrahydromethanopterin S-methyltransferase subunit G